MEIAALLRLVNGIAVVLLNKKNGLLRKNTMRVS